MRRGFCEKLIFHIHNFQTQEQQYIHSYYNRLCLHTMQTDIVNLISKYGDAKAIAKELKKLQGGDATKRVKLETALDKVLADYGTITVTRFKKEAVNAWNRAFPDGVEKREVKGYQLFVKENMQRVKADNPEATHIQRMTIIGKMWQDTKGVPLLPETSDEDMRVSNADAEVPMSGKRTRASDSSPTLPPAKKRTTRGRGKPY